MSNYEELLKGRMSKESFRKLEALKNEKVMDFVGEFTAHCNPSFLYVCDDSEEDRAFIRETAIKKGEEQTIYLKNQTIHFDGYNDQARDKANTRYLVLPQNMERMKALNSIPYDEGHREIMDIAKNIMEGKEAAVQFFCEGPAQSVFSVPCVQITDSFYVAHSENILYRPGYNHFLQMKANEKKQFFRFIHSAGRLDGRGCSINTNQRRIYMDTQNNIVYSMNNQYAGNSIGLKKHSMRLAINKSGTEGWLCEHMFLMSVQNPEKERQTYFAGAYPSACGKTSTAMVPGEKIVGDDITYFRNIKGEFRGVNMEQGIFGIIKDVNAQDDPVIFANLMKDQETIFSNILIGPDNKPYWLGCGMNNPDEGTNHHGAWKKGDRDEKDKEIPLAHSNARYTIRLDYLQNFDRQGFESKEGVRVQGILYGGRDSDTTVPIEESLSWRDGILLKACTLESETTSATIGKEGVRTPSPMANLDFLSYPLGEYTMNNIHFVETMDDPPKIFSTNYFMKHPNGNFITSKLAKKVWLHWAEGRIHGEYGAFDTPTGRIPHYQDLKSLFHELLHEDFSEEDYNYLFTFRCTRWAEKLRRTGEFFKKIDPGTPDEISAYWQDMEKKIFAAKQKYGDEIMPGRYHG
ncbi:MAG: phosphoenolpyruvate carboxykinase (GTP) [Acidobacteria bacterium]|nr:phosphoenolpyruvate carboxykinase (GTP) [Acidobacteriota bacterium]